MISDLHINNTLEPLSPKDSVAYALRRMIAYRVDLLPLIDARQHLVNYVNLYDIENMDKDIALSELPLFSPVLPFVNAKQHLFTALGHLKSLNLSLMAVLDDDGQYSGILKTSDVVMALSQSLSIRSAGSIIVIRVRPVDYSFSDISRIIEYSDAKILGFFTFEIEETGEIEIHLKLNITVLKNVLATLERYDYRVVQYFNREDLTDDLDSRYENLMKFIDI
jgi:acetoin utilization protein AcuB